MPDQPPGNPPDEPSIPALTVGELLRSAERESQALLATAGPADVTALARGWPDVLAAAAGALEAIPYTIAATGGTAHIEDHHYLTVRVIRMRDQARRFLPLGPHGHSSLREVAQSLDEATGLMRQHGHAGLTTHPSGRQDADAARVRIARTLANLAHVTVREIHNYTRMMETAAHANGRQRSLPKSLSSQSAIRRLRMLQTHEQLVLDYVNGHRGELHGEHPGPPIPASSLGVQLAGWSTTAIRRVADPAVSATDLQRVAYTQAMILRAASGFAGAAEARSDIDGPVARHLQRRMEASSRQWATTSAQWGLLHTPDSRRSDPTVISTSRALLTTLASVTTEAGGWRSPAQIDEHLEAAPISLLLRTAAEGSQSLAEIYQQLPHELHATDRLRAPAVALIAIARGRDDVLSAISDFPRYRVTVGQGDHPLSLADIGVNRLHRVTPATLTQMHHTGSALSAAAHLTLDAVLVNVPHPVLPDIRRAATPRIAPDLATGALTHTLQLRRPRYPQGRPHPGPAITP